MEEAIAKVLEGNDAEDVANEFNVHYELLKLRVREHELKQMEINIFGFIR